MVGLVTTLIFRPSSFLGIAQEDKIVVDYVKFTSRYSIGYYFMVIGFAVAFLIALKVKNDRSGYSNDNVSIDTDG